MMEVRKQKGVKGRNVDVRDVPSHMSVEILIRNIFFVSKRNLAICLDSCVFLGVACMVTCMMYDAMGYDPFLLYLILFIPLVNLGRKFLLLCAQMLVKTLPYTGSKSLV